MLCNASRFQNVKKTARLETTKGFTIIELLVTSLIIALVTGLILANNSSFNNSVLFSNQAYQVALDIRQMQVFSLGERLDGTSPRDEFGVYFDVTSPTNYVLFENSGGTELPPEYDPENDTVLASANFDSRFVLHSIEADGSPVESVAITFQRPNFDAIFCVKTDSGSSCSSSSQSEIVLVLASAADASEVRYVTVSATGQISVSAP